LTQQRSDLRRCNPWSAHVLLSCLFGSILLTSAFSACWSRWPLILSMPSATSGCGWCLGSLMRVFAASMTRYFGQFEQNGFDGANAPFQFIFAHIWFSFGAGHRGHFSASSMGRHASSAIVHALNLHREKERLQLPFRGKALAILRGPPSSKSEYLSMAHLAKISEMASTKMCGPRSGGVFYWSKRLPNVPQLTCACRALWHCR
jgi:hypothetical protein